MTTVRERLLSKTLIDFESGCWQWTASKNQYGYGQFYIDGFMLRAHRAAYELIEGPIPDGLELDHLCKNRGCINPAHLDPVTHRENVQRASPRRRLDPTRCMAGHEFTDENTLLRPDGTRTCRICNRAYSLRYRDANRQDVNRRRRDRRREARNDVAGDAK